MNAERFAENMEPSKFDELGKIEGEEAGEDGDVDDAEACILSIT